MSGASRGRGRDRQRPRWGRIGVLSCSLLVTLSAAAAAAGVLPVGPSAPAAQASSLNAAPAEVALVSDSPGTSGVRRGAASGSKQDRPPTTKPPARSGSGRRVVFDMSDQRVWLVRDDGSVAASYLVSGSTTDNLEPDHYQVFSRSRHATSFDLGSTMQFMVRFAQGDRAAIGFHDIPVDAVGRLLQRPAELGTPQSHGCIRQRRPDARRMWQFAPVGTPVVVTA